MKGKVWSELLWGQKARVLLLITMSAIMLLTMLGGREIWTQEHRWADIVYGMFYRHDFFHPYLGDVDYYDKPLLSYWFIAAIAEITGKLTTWCLRLPSALAGLLAIWSIYRLGARLLDKRLGLLAGWLLLTTFYFIFWARTSSADMLNMAGTLFAVSWYFDTKDRPSFLNYFIFGLILVVTALCKGLVGPVVAVLAILPDLCVQNNWKKHLRLSLLISVVLAIGLYMLPFWASTHFSNQAYNENGLYLVYRENILRFFQPFDHKGPIYTYFIFLPIYLLPWAIFFIPAIFSLKSRWKTMSWNSKWITWSVFILFLFFTISGSRRSYYVLPIVPFAILMTADWILSRDRRSIWAGRIVVFFGLALFVNFDVLQPVYYSKGNLSHFAEKLQTEAKVIKPWEQWQVVMLDAESKNSFYLQLPPTVKNYGIQGKRDTQTLATLMQAWPMLKNKLPNTIYITRKSYVPLIKDEFKNYKMVETDQSWWDHFFKHRDSNAPVAFIPKPSTM